MGFAIDIVSFAVMSNHFHVILRNRPDLVKAYSDEEVIRRWWMICPLHRRADGSPTEIDQMYLTSQLKDRDRLEELRGRLSSISWLLRLWTYKLARRANLESGTRGHFWEGRFNSRRLEDELALLVCMGYVELNPLRARMCASLECSEYTSVYLRIQAMSGESVNEADGAHGDVYFADAWLAPLHLPQDDRLGPCAVPCGGPRASDKGVLPLALDEYLDLLNWTANCLTEDTRMEVVPDVLEPVWERLGFVDHNWLETVKDFDERMRRWVTHPDELAKMARNLSEQHDGDTRLGRRRFAHEHRNRPN